MERVHGRGTTRVLDWSDATVSHLLVDLAACFFRTKDIGVCHKTRERSDLDPIVEHVRTRPDAEVAAYLARGRVGFTRHLLPATCGPDSGRLDAHEGEHIPALDLPRPR